MPIPVLGTVGIPGNNLFPVPESPYNAFPFLFLLYLIAGCGWFIIQKRRSPKMIGRMTRSIDAIHVRFDETDRLL